MNDHDLLEQELHSLGDDLRRPPSIAAAVLRELASDRADPTLAESSTVVRSQQEPRQKTPNGQPRRFRDRVRSRFLTSATAVAAVVVCAFLAVSLLRTDSIAFAQIRQRLASVRTASFSFRHSVVRRLADGQSAPIDIRQRVFVRGDGRMRTEGPGEIATIVSQDEFIKLETDPTKRTATLRYLYEIEEKQDILTTLRSLHESIKAITIPAKAIGGVQCPGFRIEERHSTLLVWVDPKSRLPVHAERSYAKALTEPNSDVLQADDTYDDMKFDEPLADEMFSVTPPAGYVVTIVGTPPADRKELFAEPLVVIPHVGAGPLKFGMSKAEILQQLGKPDQTEVHIPHIEVSDDTTDVDNRPRPPGAELVVLTELHVLTFKALGLRLTVEVDEGLRGIQCLGQDRIGPEGRTFRGATDKGVRIGSSAQDVVAAYGEPDKNPSSGVLSYGSLDVQFYLGEEQTVRTINVSDAGEHRLRFEWRVPNK